MVTLETAVLEALQAHKRVPQIILRHIHYHYPSDVSLEEVEATLKALESEGKVRRYCHPSGRLTHLWELVP